MLICDECHHCGSEVNRNIFRFMKMDGYQEDLYHSIGLSATPQNIYYNQILVPSLGKEIYRYSFEDAKKDKLISDFVIIETSLSLNGEEALKYGDLTESISILYAKTMTENPFLSQYTPEEFMRYVYQAILDDPGSYAASLGRKIRERRDLIYRAEARISCLIDILKSTAPDDKVIIFTEKIEQADHIYQLLSDQFSHQIAHYHSEMDKTARRNNLDAFRTGEARILVACKALDEGLNVPDASIGIIVSTASVTRQRIQRLGRILRKSPDKTSALLYYLYVKGTVEDHTYISDDSMLLTSTSVTYSKSNHQFINEEYYHHVTTIYKRNQNILITQELQEMMLCAKEGSIRADWLLDPSIQSSNKQTANTKHEENYWHLMQLIGNEHRK